MGEQTKNLGDAVTPWEGSGPEDEPARRDGFAGKKRRKFLKALARSGCVSDACRAAGISRQTFYNHHAVDAAFVRDCQLATSMASTDVELEAWRRGVVGVEEEVIAYGKVVGTRIRRSDAILRLLLQGSNRKKYGPRPGFTRKQLLAAERKQLQREADEKARAKLLAHIEDFTRKRRQRESEAAAPADGTDAGDAMERPNFHDSMSNLSTSPGAAPAGSPSPGEDQGGSPGFAPHPPPAKGVEP
jgi:hypothetical protein